MWLCAPRVGIVSQSTVNVRICTSSSSNNLGNSLRAPTNFSSSSSVRFVMFFLSECGASVLCTYASGNCGTRKDCRGLERATSESTGGEIIPRLQWGFAFSLDSTTVGKADAIRGDDEDSGRVSQLDDP
ncbi:unnamed protein product [Sphagnum balticum]